MFNGSYGVRREQLQKINRILNITQAGQGLEYKDGILICRIATPDTYGVMRPDGKSLISNHGVMSVNPEYIREVINGCH